MAADRNDVANKLLDKISEMADDVSSEWKSRAIVNMAEAWAWLLSPANAHGSSGGVTPKS